MYEAGVWAKTAKGYFKNIEEQVMPPKLLLIGYAVSQTIRTS